VSVSRKIIGFEGATRTRCGRLCMILRSLDLRHIVAHDDHYDIL
jgi:hypothetical protein